MTRGRATAMDILRGDIFYADLSPSQGSEQGGCRPVVILQNNVGNKHAPTTIVAPITSRLGKKQLPTHITFNGCGLPKDSIKAMWCGDVECEEKLKDVTGGVKSRCIPFAEEKLSDVCVCCGKPAKHMVVWGRQY